MDEPFSSLDVELRQRLGHEVRRILKASGTTAILVTHDQQEAFAIADRVGVMHDGNLEQWDRPYELYHRPATRYVADFIGQGVFLPAQVLSPRNVEIELGELRGEIPLPCQQGCATCGKGCHVEVLLRPDDVVHDDASPLKAEVMRKIFRGGDFIYTLRLDSGREVLALVPSHHDHAIGEQIGIRLDADHVITFPAPADAVHHVRLGSCPRRRRRSRTYFLRPPSSAATRPAGRVGVCSGGSPDVAGAGASTGAPDS